VSLGEQLLAALSQYGVSILAAVLFAGCVGLPLPNALLLIASGSFIAGGQMNLWSVLIVATVASIAGDLSGYTIGRWLGHAALRRINPAFRERLDKAEQSARKWGGWGVFLSRWLITPLGPWVNLLSGASEYPLPRFVLWDVLGEILWVVLYVSLGRAISGEVQSISAVAGDLMWVMLAFLVVGVLAWRVWKSRRTVTS
jgi:membrane protein DedA with SNARE-associated domain